MGRLKGTWANFCLKSLRSVDNKLGVGVVDAKKKPWEALAWVGETTADSGCTPVLPERTHRFTFHHNLLSPCLLKMGGSP